MKYQNSKYQDSLVVVNKKKLIKVVRLQGYLLFVIYVIIYIVVKSLYFLYLMSYEELFLMEYTKGGAYYGQNKMGYGLSGDSFDFKRN